MKSPRFRPRLPAAPAALLLAVLAGCASAPAPAPRPSEPPNLWLLKQELIAYADSGAYERGLAEAAAEAQAWVEQRAAQKQPGERLAIVFDLDETLLSNLPHIRARDFGYEPAVWAAWVEEAAAPAIPSVAAVYRAALARGVTVFYLTGRNEKGRAATEKNLRRLGLDGHAGLFCKPDDTTETSQAFKTAVRRKITEEGWTIIANLGDQQSDLDGGYAERAFKLPNPFYITK